VNHPGKFNVLLTVLGSLGDLHPYIRMATELRDGLGCAATIATSKKFKERIESLGFSFIPLKPSDDDLGEKSEWVKRAMDPQDGPEYILREFIMPFAEHNLEVLNALPEFDLYISHPLTFGTPIIAEKRSKPWLSIALAPISVISSFDPPLLPRFEFLEIFRGRSRAVFEAFFIAGNLITKSWTEPVQKMRLKMGLARIKDSPILRGQYSPYGTLICFPSWIGERQADWPANSQQIGFPFYDADERKIPAELEGFMDGEFNTTVYTLGSIAVEAESEFFDVAARVHIERGEPAVFLCGEQTELVRARLPRSNLIAVTPFAPHSVLFPRAKTVVHQAGIGTLSQAMLGGRPQIIVPFANDQFDNARRAKKLGIAQVIQLRKWSEKTLSQALNNSQEPNVLKQAMLISKSLKNDNFSDEFVRAVRSFVHPV
jgi:rhamnosyltransferase subunit B